MIPQNKQGGGGGVSIMKWWMHGPHLGASFMLLNLLQCNIRSESELWLSAVFGFLSNKQGCLKTFALKMLSEL